MRTKRSLESSEELSQHKKSKSREMINRSDYFEIILNESGLQINDPPDKCKAYYETLIIVRNLKKNLLKNSEYQNNLSEFFSNFEKRCVNLDVFKHYLLPNIIRVSGDGSSEHFVTDSVLKILLCVPTLQIKFADYVFDKAIEYAPDNKYGPMIRMILKCFSSLDNIVDYDKISTHLIDLLHVTSEKMLRLEIITALPDIIGDQAHDNVANELSAVMDEHELIPGILDCLSYLCLSDEQYEQLQKKTMLRLMTLSKCSYFPNFVNFLLMARRTSNNTYLVVQGLRNALSWSTSIDKLDEIASSQILTATAMRNSIMSSKVISSAWLKVITDCKVNTDHKPFDFVIIIILYSTSEEKQKQLENIIRTQIKHYIINEDLLDSAFEKFKPILKEYLRHLISLTNSLLKTTSEPLIQDFASHVYTRMFADLKDCCQSILAELLQLALVCKQCLMTILSILNNVAYKDISTLKPQSLQMLTLLDRMDDMNISEISAVMNILCGLAYSTENSIIRDDIHMIIRKELGSSNPSIKVQGILAGIYSIKFLMASKNGEDDSVDLTDDISYMLTDYLPEGDLREAAQIIELINRSTRQFPDMTAFFYDELCKIIQSMSYINKHFLHWITEAVTNDLQQNFIVIKLDNKLINNLKLSMLYQLNTDSEMTELISVKIGSITLEATEDINAIILCPLFNLVQILHAKKNNGDLTSIDALLGCPVIMPIFDIDLIDELSNSTISLILDCQVHCVNWFRELINAFAYETVLKSKIYMRLSHIQKLENLISQILLKINFIYKPPGCNFSPTGNHLEKKTLIKRSIKQKTQKRPTHEDSHFSDSLNSQHNSNNSLKSKLDIIQTIPFRPLSLNVLNLLNNVIQEDNEEGICLTIENLIFILKYVNNVLESMLISRIKKKTFLSRQDIGEYYDHQKAEKCAKSVNEILPKIIDHMKYITLYLDKYIGNEEKDLIYNKEILNHISGLENILNLFLIYFKWVGFKSHHKALLKISLQTIIVSDNDSSSFLHDLILAAAKYFQKYVKYCIQLSTATLIIEIVNVMKDYSSNPTITKVLRDLAHHFLCQQWCNPDGIIEKGLLYDQHIDIIAKVYFLNNDVPQLKNIALLLVNDAKSFIESHTNRLNSFKSINKNNFTILYRNLGHALHEITKNYLNKRLTNLEHLNLWKDVVSTLRCMSEIAKLVQNRNNLNTFFKKSLPIIRLFLSQGILILELEFKRRPQEIIEILKTLQQSTRFLQTLCCHSRLKKDTAILKKVPQMRQLLETLIYKVKAMLAAHNCSDAFWMGNLRNKNIQGEVIASQENTHGEMNEDCDEQLPADDNSDDTDNEILDPDSNSVSDTV